MFRVLDVSKSPPCLFFQVLVSQGVGSPREVESRRSSHVQTPLLIVPRPPVPQALRFCFLPTAAARALRIIQAHGPLILHYHSCQSFLPQGCPHITPGPHILNTTPFSCSSFHFAATILLPLASHPLLLVDAFPRPPLDCVLHLCLRAPPCASVFVHSRKLCYEELPSTTTASSPDTPGCHTQVTIWGSITSLLFHVWTKE